MATEFRSEKILRNRFGMDSVIPRKKESIPKLGTEIRSEKFVQETAKITCPYLKSHQIHQKGIPSYFLFRGMVRNRIQEIAPIFVTRNGIPSICLLRGIVRNEIPKVCFYFCSTLENSEHFSLPREWFGTEL